ncbi:response regulator [Desulfovibrio sp. OttesenSCG-928-G15]|nr:response regulator [Desulfovibrio sp. OttesenSCG-928-G15]
MAKILIVDDSLPNLQHVKGLLADSHTVLLAKSGEQALTIASRQYPDSILLDIDMPQMDGFETLRRLRSNAALASIPVIFLTANHDAETEIRGLRAGAQDFIAKPFEKSILIHRLDLHLRLSAYRNQLQETVRNVEDSIAVNLAELIECRDENTGGHVQRTGDYFALLGKALIDRSLFPDELDAYILGLMARAAPLHDIGKIGVSDVVLLKPGKLTDEEFATIKKHPTIGAEILGAMAGRLPSQLYLRYAKLIALSHHERYDGKGYPHGVAGENIPLCARIMAIVDVYDALVADRVYRPAMPHDEAVRIIREGRGTSFDPVITDVFLDVQEAFRR